MRGFGLTDGRFFITLGLFYSIIHSGLEKYYWRWFVFGRMRRTMPWIYAAFLSSFGFTAHHVLLLGTYFCYDSLLCWFASFGVAVGGFYWCWLYKRSDSIWGSCLWLLYHHSLAVLPFGTFRPMKIFQSIILFLVVLFFIPFCTAAEIQTTVIHQFLGHLKAKNFGDAVALFSDELRFQCSEQQLAHVMNRITSGEFHISGTQFGDWKNRTTIGEWVNFGPVKITAYPNLSLIHI